MKSVIEQLEQGIKESNYCIKRCEDANMEYEEFISQNQKTVEKQRIKVHELRIALQILKESTTTCNNSSTSGFDKLSQRIKDIVDDPVNVHVRKGSACGPDPGFENLRPYYEKP